MSRAPIRRAQLIAPFGPGAMLVAPDGTSIITAGLDCWYKREGGSGDDIDLEEFRVEEWRLQRELHVTHFRLPPDYRSDEPGRRIPNTRLEVPFLRFPQWHFCPRCRRLDKRTLFEPGRIRCASCKEKNKTSFLEQVPFVAMCDLGHIQDFPWKEWVHRSPAPECSQPLRLVATGGATLAAQKVVCGCGAERTLGQITAADSQDDSATYLSQNLSADGTPFLCQGLQPWLGIDEPGRCDRPLRGSLRSASNVYFAHVRSAIYLPRGSRDAPSALVSLLERPPFSTVIRSFQSLGMPVDVQRLRSARGYAELLREYSDSQVEAALQIVTAPATRAGPGRSEPLDAAAEAAFRRQEYECLQRECHEEDLYIRSAPLREYQPAVRRYFSRIMLVHKLRETRAFVGFTRIFPEDGRSLDERKAMLWRHPPADDQWLPAYVVYGEGIFLEFSEECLRQWEQRQDVQARMERLFRRYAETCHKRRLPARSIGPRFVLVHTFAHLLMNRLTFECGYSSASLRERLYVSQPYGAPNDAPMAGVLIYTASGDAEGTLGGLVRMGKPGYLEPVIRRALEGAQWCSADPVCMEAGRHGGQGPDSCNLAACHACALVPETACEEFNRLLDRAAVVGDLQSSELGFFRDF